MQATRLILWKRDGSETDTGPIDTEHTDFIVRDETTLDQTVRRLSFMSKPWIALGDDEGMRVYCPTVVTQEQGTSIYNYLVAIRHAEYSRLVCFERMVDLTAFLNAWLPLAINAEFTSWV